MKRETILLLVVLMLASRVAAQTKVVTNADLEKFRQKRVQNDLDYDRKVKENGFPSRPELERRETERQKGLREFAANAQTKLTNAENYWQAQAVELIEQIAQINAEINYIQANVNQNPARQIYSTGYLPYGFYNNNLNNFGNGAVYSDENFRRTRIGGNIVFGSRARTRVGIGTNSESVTGNQSSRFTFSPRFPNRTRGNSPFGNSPYRNGLLIASYGFPNYNDYTRDDLLIQLRSLEQTRAGLYARYALLQDAARRDGVQI
ncbi:MAG: hypothetical protein H7Z37_00240 [Pyrinomonadaceae bacterium]|nr:hypothetical protein [Pyrinomonadaceae bacterium]